MRTCMHCGGELLTTNSKAIYCSKLCKLNAFKARKARGEVLPPDERAAARAESAAEAERAAEAARAARAEQAVARAAEAPRAATAREPESMAAERRVQLDALTEDFIRAVRVDPSYVIEFAEAGAKILDRRGLLDPAA